MPAPEIDEKLKSFLAWNEEQRRAGHTIAAVLSAQHHFALQLRGLNGRVSAVEADNTEIHDRLDHHGAAIVAIKRRVRNGTEDTEMDTGQFDLAAIRAKVEEQEQRRRESERAKAEETVWWKRSIIAWVIGGLAFVAATSITVLITMAIAGNSQQRYSPPPQRIQQQEK